MIKIIFLFLRFYHSTRSNFSIHPSHVGSRELPTGRVESSRAELSRAAWGTNDNDTRTHPAVGI